MRKSHLRLPAALLVLAGLFAFARWVQSIQAIPGETVRFSGVHDLKWDPETKSMTRTGTDPYVWFALPPSATPIRRVSFDFDGPYVANEGSFYVFQSPAALKETELGPVVVAEVHATPGRFVISGKLQDSRALRLDLPDFLPRTVQFPRVVIETPFVRWSSWSFRLMLGSLAAAVAALIVALRTRRPRSAQAPQHKQSATEPSRA